MKKTQIFAQVKDIRCPKKDCLGTLFQHPRISELLVCDTCRGLWELLRFNAATWKKPDSLEFEEADP